MTTNPLAITIRARKLGVLIRDARLASRKTTAECAEAIGVSLDQYEEYELGEQSPSLPELELLALYLQVPMEHFWGSSMLSANEQGSSKVDPEGIIRLRQRMVGVMIRQVRMEWGISLERAAEMAGMPVDALENVEFGESPIPLPNLEALAAALNRPVRDFQDRHGPLGAWAARQKSIKELSEMPPELRDFVSKPINRPYLELAQRLSEMSVDKLRAVAEGLLEITL